MTGAPAAAGGRVSRWLHDPLPESRAAVFRVLVYLFVPVDVLVTHTSGQYRGALDDAWYKPLLVGRLLPLPVPTDTVVAVCKWGSVAVALLAVAVAATGRGGRWAPHILGWTVCALWFEYQVIAFSYGKVDHDRFAYLVALAVVPLLGSVRLRSDRLSENAAWALRCVQLAVIATYVYAAFAKLRFGGPEWVNSATIARAVVRRGTELAEPLLQVPWTLQATQWGIMAMELGAPLVFLASERWRRRVVVGFLGFHGVTWAMITIVFLPHVLCLLCFLPLERLVGMRFAEVEPPPLHGRRRWLGLEPRAAERREEPAPAR